MPALPIYPGTRAYDSIPVQWSDHILHEDGTLHHYEHLHEGNGDPRREFAASLLRTLGRRGHRGRLLGLREKRLADLAA